MNELAHFEINLYHYFILGLIGAAFLWILCWVAIKQIMKENANKERSNQED